MSKNIRFFLPIPPLGVAAYVFVFNMFSYYQGHLPSNVWDTIGELFFSALVSGVVFITFIAANVFITNLLKGIF